MRRIVVGAALLFTGFVVGLVLTGRTPPPDESAIVAAPQTTPAPAPSRSAAMAASVSGLPDLSDVAERAVQASVNISSTSIQRVQIDPFFRRFYGGDPMRSQTSLGSGVIVSGDGFILTNSHVIGTAPRTDIKVTLPDNRELPGRLVGIDTVSDLAVVKIEAQNLATLPWGDSSKLRVAQWVLAVGNPFAFSQTVTLGIVSAVNRHNPQLATYADMIQTDAAINPGNSGGALINSKGELIGINTMIYSETGGYQGIGFAIPANLAREVMDQLIQNHEVARGSIGLNTLQTVDPDRAAAAGYGHINGVLIYDMYRNSPADRAGLRPDDIITKFNGQDVTDSGQLQHLILDAKIGSTVKVDFLRGRRPMTADVAIEKMTR
jgi:Do/DeqQ family serine protease